MSNPDVRYHGHGYGPRNKDPHRGQNVRQPRPQQVTGKKRHDTVVQPRPHLSFNDHVNIAQGRIKGVMTHRTFNGCIRANGPKDVITFLVRYIDNRDGKCGRRDKLYGVLEVAVKRLIAAEVFVENDRGYFEYRAL